MRLLVSSGDVECWSWCVCRGDVLDVEVELAGDEAFEASDGVSFRVAFGDSSFEVGDGWCVAAAESDHDEVWSGEDAQFDGPVLSSLWVAVNVRLRNRTMAMTKTAMPDAMNGSRPVLCQASPAQIPATRRPAPVTAA